MAGINITLGGNFGKLDELKKKTKDTAQSIKGSFAGIGKSLATGISGAAVAGTAAAFAGIAASMKTAIDAGGELNDMMAQTGAAGKGLLVMQRAFKNAGLAAGDVAPALQRMQKALAGVNEEGQPTNAAFKKLGLSVADLTAMDPVAAFQKISEAIAAIAMPAQRTAVAMELFGKSGGKMLSVVTDASAFSAAAEQLGTLGDVLPEIAADADFVGDAVGTLDTKMQQLGAGVLQELMPALLEVAKTINTADFVSLGQDIGRATKDAYGFAEAIAEVVKFTSYIPRKVLEGSTYIPRKAIEGAASLNPEKGTALPMVPGVSIGADGKAVVETPPPGAGNAPTAPVPTGRKMADTKGPNLAEAMEHARMAEKVTAEKQKQKAIAADEFKLEAAILQARLTGDTDRLAKLTREKSLREEMAKLTGAGWDEKTAREQAGKMVDARAAADRAEASRKSGVQSNAGGLGAFAQSMNVLFGRSANTGLIEENKRQTKLLQTLVDRSSKTPAPVKIEVVPSFS